MQSHEPIPPPSAPVSTILTPDERLRVDAAGQGLYHTLHRDSIDDVIRDVRERRVTAVLVSVSCCGQLMVPRVAKMVREFPRVPAVALLTQLGAGAADTVLSLGLSGVSTLVDVRDPAGWRALRNVLRADHATEFEQHALAELRTELAGVPDDCWRFFELLFLSAPRVSTVREMIQPLDVLPSTLMSRFFRLRLPAPKRYLAGARLTRAARLLENAGLSIANVADRMEYSSPQSFGRHVRATLGMTALEFRRRYDGEGMLQRFRDELVRPYLAILRRLTPFSAPPGWMGR
jgi:AraC-like DNA-binding protein